MKPGVLFWSAVSAGVVFLLWVVLCLFVIGVPVSRAYGLRAFWSPADQLLDARTRRSLQEFLQSAVNILWGLAAYSGPAELDATWERVDAPIRVEIDCGVEIVPRTHTQSVRATLVVVGPQVDVSRLAYDIYYVSLSAGQVLTYVVLIPGVHFALAAFVLALVVNGATRLLFKAIGLPEDASGENGKE